MDIISYSDLQSHETLELSDLGKGCKVVSGCLQVSDLDVEYVPNDFILKVVSDAPEWLERGLQQTASGYGKKLISRFMVHCADNRKRRVYITQFSNCGSAWLNIGGVKKHLHDYQLNGRE